MHARMWYQDTILFNVLLIHKHIVQLFLFSGYCSRYSEIDGRFINKPDLDYTVFDPPCPNRFSSNESYKCKELIV